MLPRPYTGQIDAADALTPEQKFTFIGGSQTVLLPAGSELWRFVSRKNGHKFGTYWLDPATMTTIMQALHTHNNFSEAFKKDNIRNNLAILTSWSNLSWRVKIKLSKDVIAYVGQTDTKKYFEEQDNNMPFGGGNKMHKVIETRMGRCLQYVIPRFARLPDPKNWASVETFVHI
jgi:hypothetical protein